MSDEIFEECGVFAVAGHPKAVELCYYGLYALQHRGQESAGIAYVRGDRIITQKGMGLVSDVFDPSAIRTTTSDIAIGHVRYSKHGEKTIENAQPITVNMWRGPLSFAHNGNIVNAQELRNSLERDGSIFQTRSDSEVIPHLLAKFSSQDMTEAMNFALSKLRGAYALLALTPQGVYGAKDTRGFRPLCLGELDGAWVLSSESCGLDAVGAKFVRELEPGEIVSILRSSDLKFSCSSFSPKTKTQQSMCIFEFIYFARPDSDIKGVNVHAARKALGRRLAQKGPVDADLCTGVPDSSLSAASGFAEEARLPYEMGLVKNRYVGRTFIAPVQSTREFGVKIKLNALRSLIQGKRVVLVDDSIVRGTTSKYIVGLLRSAGAKEIHVRISSPPYKFPCCYGIDTATKEELTASNLSVEGIRESIGADSLVFLDLEDLSEVLGKKVGGFCAACFSGDYPAGVPHCVGKN
jgi:amidophosphoribosyltransferase